MSDERRRSGPSAARPERPPGARPFSGGPRRESTRSEGPPTDHGPRNGPPPRRDGPPARRDGPPARRDGPPARRDGPPGERFERRPVRADEGPRREIFPDQLVFDGDLDAPKFVMAHGAGAAADHPWMEDMTARLAERGVCVVRFDFPYMQQARRTGVRRPPDPPDRLLQCYIEVLEYLGDPSEVFIGGKSMGGRMASLLADEVGVRGLICLGFPFHAPGQPVDRDRLMPWREMKSPSLIVQGTRDPMGSEYDMGFYKIGATTRIALMEDGDHSFSPRRISGRTLDDNMGLAADAVARFIFADKSGERLKTARLVRPAPPVVKKRRKRAPKKSAAFEAAIRPATDEQD